MNYIDVFNGDADGICALHQLRLAAPCDAQLVTGVKRDIALLQRVSAEAGDQVTVLDISLDKNRHELLRLLAGDVDVHYFDHHFAELKKTLPLPVAFQDERLSTWTAKERLYAQGLREKKVLEKLDQTAAAVILEDFLATNPHLTGKPL